MATVEHFGSRSPEVESGDRSALIELVSDYSADGQYGFSSLRVTSEAIFILDQAGATLFQIPISEIASARNEPIVGGGRLEVTTTDGRIVPIVTYSNTLSATFSEAARGIEQLGRGEELSINLKKEKLRCPKCNRLLPEKDGVCPACVNRGKTLARIASYMLPYKKTAFLLVSCSLVGTALNLVPPWIKGNLIDGVLQPKQDAPFLYQMVGLWLVVMLVTVLFEILRGRLVAFLAGNIAADLRRSVYRAIQFLQLRFFDKKAVGAIASRVTSDTDRVWGFLVDGLPFFATNALLLVGVAVLMLLTNWHLTLLILAPLPIVGLISVVFWKPMAQMFHRVGQKWARFHIHLNESLHGIRVVKVFAKEDTEYAKFNRRNEELRDSGVNADKRWYTIFGAMTFFTAVATLIHWSVGGTMVIRGEMTLGNFWKINEYVMLVYGPLQWFAQVNNWFSRAMAGAERIFEVIDTETEDYGDHKLAHAIDGEVQFENVRFGYDKSNPVLKGLTFTAAPGDMIGLVGKSGAGKSTTINLICRFYEPDVGSILIDGKDYREMSLQDMRSQIGVVLQEPFLFNGTISENIAYGRPGATFEEIIEAARAANAHEFILAKPDGYDTLVGERGGKLSGGERQRVSIARAILHNPRILILDEATSSVDVETEKQIQEAIGRLIEGRTTFAIAHRLSTLRNATKLIVLEKGEIVEMGTHEELMAKKGAFCNLVETQSEINEIIGVNL